MPLSTLHPLSTSPPLPNNNNNNINTTYIYSILPLPLPTGPALATISSDDILRFFDCATLQPLQPIRQEQKQERVHEGLTCLTLFGCDGGGEGGGGGGGSGDGQSVLTGGRDGVVRGWDLRVGGGMEGLEIYESNHAPLLSLDSHGPYVATGAELSNAQACVTVWDYRSTKRPLVRYVESHNDDITELQFHPTNPRRLLSGSMDGLINVYDTTIVDEDDALLQIINHGSSISHAGFLSDTEIYALSHDESFTVQQLIDDPDSDSDSDPDAGPGDEAFAAADQQPRWAFGDLRPVLNCEYVVDVIPSGQGEVMVGAGSHSLQNNQYLDLVPLRFDHHSQWSLATNQSIRIPGGHGSEIIRSFCFNHPAQTVFTAGEDGLIRAWRTLAAGEEEGGEEEKEDGDDDGDGDKREGRTKKIKEEEKKVGKKRKKMKSEGIENERYRYRPY